MDTYFNDKVAVVTGAGGVICSQVSKELAGLGMTVVLVGLTLEKLQKVEKEIKEAGGKCKVYACDVTDEARVNVLAETVVAEFGKVDYLVNGAGGNSSKATTNIPKFDPRELAEQAGISVNFVYSIRRGKYTKPKYLGACCRVLNIKVEDVIESEG